MRLHGVEQARGEGAGAVMALAARASEMPLPPGLGVDRSLDLLIALGLMALVPLALVTLTSFLKIAVVLSVVRSALGAPQVPPNTAVTGLALLLTAVVMAPVGEQSWAAFRSAHPAHGVEESIARLSAAAEPLRRFLARQARADDRRTFLDISSRLRGAEGGEAQTEDSFAVLAPAFVISELRRAFTIGFLVFLPFLVVDLLVANVLLALGLTQLSPTSFSLPFKLVLFVAVDGWSVLARGLAAGYLT
jgi:type III secretion protein R